MWKWSVTVQTLAALSLCYFHGVFSTKQQATRGLLGTLNNYNMYKDPGPNMLNVDVAFVLLAFRSSRILYLLQYDVDVQETSAGQLPIAP